MTRDRPPLRALFVNENIGGNATMHLHLRAALSQRPDVEATFLDAAGRGPLRKAAGAAVPGLGALDLDFAPLRDQLALSAHVRRRLRRCRTAYDVVHVYTHNAALLSTDLLRATPTVVGLDATSRQSLRLLPYRRPTRFTQWTQQPGVRLEQRVYAAADAIVAKSEWARRSLLDDYGIPAERVRLIPYGIEVPDVPDVARDPELIAFVGRSMTRKGGWLLLDAWRRRLRPHARLLLVTPEDVPPEPGLTVVRDVRPGDGRLHGLLASAAVLAFPSTGDTFGYAALEAMALQTPVVAARSAAIPEIVEDGVSGVLVEPENADALAAGLERVLGEQNTRRALGQAARATVLDRFDARVTTAELVRLLRDVRGESS
jgi:glycosyltransferase involved in cell wall biosynthesis